MNAVAMRTTADVHQSLSKIEEVPTVVRAHEAERTAGDSTERIGVVVLEDGIERVPPAVCRAIGEGDFGIDSIEEYPDGHREVVLR